MGDAVIYAWREEQGDVWTGEWALDRKDKWVPAEANKYILATPEALAASPEVQALIREAEARGMERALGIMNDAGDSAVTEAMGQRLCCNGQYCGCHGATVEEYLEHLIRAEAAAIRETKHD